MSTFIGTTERRNRESVSISSQRKQALSAQEQPIKQLEEEGYSLWFVRRLSEDNRLVVMQKNSDKQVTALIYYDGEIDYNPKIKFRK